MVRPTLSDPSSYYPPVVVRQLWHICAVYRRVMNLTAMDEFLIHQLPQPLPQVAIPRDGISSLRVGAPLLVENLILVTLRVLVA